VARAAAKPGLRARLEAVAKKAGQAKKAAAAAAADRAVADLKAALAADQALADKKVIVMEVGIGLDTKAIKNVLEVVSEANPDAAFLGVSKDEESGKMLAFASVPEALVGEGLKAGDWVAAALAPCGG
ncbi:unnamed protein product, partial [Heterosigma akashiwo]